MGITISDQVDDLLDLAQYVIHKNWEEVINHLVTLRKEKYKALSFYEEIPPETPDALLLKITINDASIVCFMVKRLSVFSGSMLFFKNTLDTLKVYEICQSKYISFMEHYRLNGDIQIGKVKSDEGVFIQFNPVYYNKYDNEYAITQTFN